MALTTFQGPLRTGTIREGSIAAGFNAGVANLCQFYDTGNLTGTAVGNVDVQFGNLPQGAMITDIFVDQVVAAGTGTMTISVGVTSGGSELMAGVNSSAGGRFRGTATAATQLAWQTSTTADTKLYVRIAVATGTLTAGRAIIGVTYLQRLADGTVVKTTYTS